MSCRVCFVLLCAVAIAVSVKGSPGKGAALWAKYASRPLTNKGFVQESAPIDAGVVQSRDGSSDGLSIGAEVKAAPAAPAAEETPEPETVAPVTMDSVPEKREIPLFARMILGDPEHPKLAKVEDIRSVDLRSGSYNLELPNERTIPVTKLLVEKTAELVRLFQQIQEESNGFVEDIERHNSRSDDDFIGYFN